VLCGFDKLRDLCGLTQIGTTVSRPDTRGHELRQTGLDDVRRREPVQGVSQRNPANALAVANPIPPKDPVIRAVFPASVMPFAPASARFSAHR
jgi:hypothetical protein